jgi:Ca2+-binding RTX toxin-like protein
LSGEGAAQGDGTYLADELQELLGGSAGSDTFVTRAGDGGVSIAEADVITDFQDGSDQIGLEGLSFTDLMIEQGAGDYANDTIVRYGAEYLFVIQNTVASNVTYLDIVSTSTEPQVLTGSSADDIILGGSGSDTIASGSGDDIIVGYSGDDSITIDGYGYKSVDGGPGTDSLTISYGSISSISDFTIGISDGYVSLTDSGNNQILHKGVETLVVGGNSYISVYGGTATNGANFNTSGIYYDPEEASFSPDTALQALNFGNNIISSTYYDAVSNEAYLYSYGEGNGSHVSVSALASLEYDSSNDLAIYGTAFNDLIAGGSSLSMPGQSAANLTVYGYGGFDVIDMSARSGTDTVDAGAGDDIVYVSSTDYADDLLLDGGAGTDTLFFVSTSSAITYSLNTAPTANFETVYASLGNDVLTGDANNNRLVGYGGADTLIGGLGDDVLYGHFPERKSPYIYEFGLVDTNDRLYGGAGNDSLYGGAGDDLLDGGSGRDVLSGEGAAQGDGTYLADELQELLGGSAGSDTFVIRAGDGGSSISGADVIMDFEDGDDIIGMSGLNYSDLTVEQGSGDYSNHVVVKKTDTGEFLTIIQNINISAIDDNDFSAI